MALPDGCGSPAASTEPGRYPRAIGRCTASTPGACARLWPNALVDAGYCGIRRLDGIGRTAGGSRLLALPLSPRHKHLIKHLGGGAANVSAGFLSAIFAFCRCCSWHLRSRGESVVGGRAGGTPGAPSRHSAAAASGISGPFRALATATVFIGVITLLATERTWRPQGSRSMPERGGGNAGNDSAGFARRSDRISRLGLAAHGRRHGTFEYPAVDLVLHQLHRPGADWPGAIQRLSALYYYGTPLLHGWYVGDILGLLAVALVALVLASLRFVKKDIAR